MADGVIRLHGLDNVVIALQDMPAGSHPTEVAASLSGAVPRGHKIAARAIAKGEEVILQLVGVGPSGHILGNPSGLHFAKE